MCRRRNRVVRCALPSLASDNRVNKFCPRPFPASLWSASGDHFGLQCLVDDIGISAARKPDALTPVSCNRWAKLFYALLGEVLHQHLDTITRGLCANLAVLYFGILYRLRCLHFDNVSGERPEHIAKLFIVYEYLQAEHQFILP